ncbi:hypothetical protein PsW64_01797 [Pseudovibrio sp. W64]|uniref:NACHT domain-containing protein n=1 Tax=Pseudovibrio sp. W64 TaxID=1735583 RepID=UPI0007AE91D2|nr:hypothetical protein [Pseudovibrio sp. W64]KZK84127.1 hypothetical protein PsW64_01797 [Pseudovibrio sp. W64]
MPDGKLEVLSEMTFASLCAPLVLLGEPGAGKSETATALAEALGYQYVSADRLATGAPVSLSKNCTPIIDGLDETQGSGSEAPLLTILKRLNELQIQTFLILCRGADWADTQNERFIHTWFDKAPVVGHLQPLKDAEIAAMVDDLVSYAGSGDAFLKEAENNNALDLARNPQTLKLLLAAIQRDGWPRTKSELYQNACESFADEHNEIHRSLNSMRPNRETILSTAGFICSQLLLSGQRGLNIDGQDDEFHARLVEFEDETTNAKNIKAAISTPLFRSSRPNKIEPCHRTVAEFLAAKWLSERLRTGTLSIRRLETLLCKNGNVPRSLRGIHAWLATLDRSLTSRLVPNDPYGCFRYGDVEQYSNNQARQLLRQLQILASIDPYFRSEDWEGQVGTGLARDVLSEDIVKLIQNPDVPHHLSTVILESLKGTTFANSIQDELRTVLLDEKITALSRDRALSALRAAKSDENWHELAHLLSQSGDYSSACLAVEIVIENSQLFTGDQIAGITNAYDEVKERLSENLSIGISFRLMPKLSLQQCVAAISNYGSQLPEERYERSSYTCRIQERFLDTAKTYLQRGGRPTAHELWHWLRNVTDDQYRSLDWDTFSTQFFLAQAKLRRQTQSLALAGAAPEEYRLINMYLGAISTGLQFHEGDLAFHLESLFYIENEISDFTQRWMALVECAFANRSFNEEARILANHQAQNRSELKTILLEIANRPPPKWMAEQVQRQHEQKVQQEIQNRKRHQHYTDNREVVRKGQSLSELHTIATSYMGLFIDVEHIQGASERVEWLVGPENLEAAIHGLSAACQRTDMPTPLSMATLKATESKEFNLARVALVGCALQQTQYGNLASLPQCTLATALAAADWGFYVSETSIPSTLEDDLRELLFEDISATEPFVRATIEPMLLAGKEHISGLRHIFEVEGYASLAAKLSIEWLAQSEKMHEQTLIYTLKAALRLASRAELKELTRTKLHASVWPTPKHKVAWFVMAFLVDFEQSKNSFSNYLCDNQWVLNEIISIGNLENGRGAAPITALQLSFLIETYAARFPQVPPPKGGWSGGDPYLSARFIDVCISKLGECLTESARSELHRLITSIDLSNHKDHARHVAAEQVRAMAETDWSTHTLSDVRQVLLAGVPKTVEDLKSVVMDEIEAMQARLLNGSFNAVRPFWDQAIPHIENYCRDLIASQLEPYLIKYGVRVLPEGTMLNGTRCDLLCSIGEIGLPIEIKGQWHAQVWTAASEQLESNYSHHYRAEGYGIYLVLWFGNVANYNPPGIRKIGPIESADAMLSLIHERSPRPISAKTKAFVLDVSRPEGDGEEENKG